MKITITGYGPTVSIATTWNLKKGNSWQLHPRLPDLGAQVEGEEKAGGGGGWVQQPGFSQAFLAIL